MSKPFATLDGRMVRLLAFALVLALAATLSCAGRATHVIVDVRPAAPKPLASASGPLVMRFRPGTRPRFLPAIGVLHETSARARGRDFRIDATGHPTRIEGDPFASVGGMSFVEVVGDWPRTAWARVATRRGADDDVAERRIVQWNGSAWTPSTDLRAQPSSRGAATLLGVERWGGDGALAVRFMFEETATTIEEGRRAWQTRCEPAEQLDLGTSDAPPPATRIGDCLFAPHALATSPTRDVFLLVQPRLGRPFLAEPVGWGPLEVWRWSPGQVDPARDDLASMLGFRPGVLDAWEHRTLLVVSPTDAYLAVTSPPSWCWCAATASRARRPPTGTSISTSPTTPTWPSSSSGPARRRPPASAGRWRSSMPWRRPAPRPARGCMRHVRADAVDDAAVASMHPVPGALPYLRRHVDDAVRAAALGGIVRHDAFMLCSH